MVGALVEGALLFGFINIVFDRFITTDAVNLVLGKKLGPDLVERLKISLLAAEALLMTCWMLSSPKLPLERMYVFSRGGNG
ncbi:uncharacterized protein DS421_16g548020 [Arachis hypogaea]|nr:uncharacterized protein DS421_16g548020 [Arachis hypogaea]